MIESPENFAPATATEVPLKRRREKNAERGIIPTLERLGILFGIYVFSIGPMYWTWYEAKYLHGSYVVAVLYEPLWRLAGIIPPLGHWLNWYVKWWNL